MRISEFETFVVGTPPPHNGGPFWVFVKLVTDTGLVGYGEVYGIPFGPKVWPALIEDVITRHVIGQSPFDIERMWRNAYSANYTQRPDSAVSAVISGIEIAMWDLVGKATGQPIHNLLGGRIRDRLRSYTYIYPDGDDLSAYTDPKVAVERAKHYIGLGFTALKFDPVGPYTATDPRQLPIDVLDYVDDFVATLRDGVGNKADLLFGTHGQLTPSSAIRLAKRLEPADPLWFEEPTSAENPEDMARIAAATSVPIATGERLATKYEFARVLRCNAASILQPALGKVGGILEAKKIAAIAETHYAEMAPHLYAGPIEAAANVQLGVTLPNFLVQESIETMGGFHAKLLDQPVTWKDGYLMPNERPGLGVNLNEDVARANPYKGNAYHLNMPDDPSSWPLNTKPHGAEL